MKDKRHPSQLTKRELWFRIVRRSRRQIRKLEQLIIDANHFNGMPQMANETPYDIEPDRVLLHTIKADLADFLDKNPEPPHAS